MSRSRSGAAVRLLAVLCVTAGCAAALQQQEMTKSPTETPTVEPTFWPDEEEELELPCDCSDLPMGSPSGVYNLSLGRASSQPPVPAYCDMDTDGGNWTVFQRRDGLLGIPKNQRQSFKQKWNAYKHGFGSLTGEFWWGLEYLHILTQEKERQYELRIYLTSAEGIINPAGLVRYAVYRNFWISSEDTGYALNYDYYKQLGYHNASTQLGDGFRYYHRYMKFSTSDRDNSGEHCASRGGWWYLGLRISFGRPVRCSSTSFLNGPPNDPDDAYSYLFNPTMFWSSGSSVIRWERSVMMIKPVSDPCGCERITGLE